MHLTLQSCLDSYMINNGVYFHLYFKEHKVLFLLYNWLMFSSSFFSSLFGKILTANKNIDNYPWRHAEVLLSVIAAPSCACRSSSQVAYGPNNIQKEDRAACTLPERQKMTAAAGKAYWRERTVITEGDSDDCINIFISSHLDFDSWTVRGHSLERV